MTLLDKTFIPTRTIKVGETVFPAGTEVPGSAFATEEILARYWRHGFLHLLGGDTTAHNTDNAAHPDIRDALANATSVVDGEYLLTDFGTVDLTGAADATAVLNAALAAMYAAGGGTLVFPAGDILVAGQVVIPDDGGGITTSDAPLGMPHRWVGQGAWAAGQTYLGDGGTRLICTFDGAAYNDAKFVTRGLGQWVIEDITFQDTTALADTPIIFTTNTTLKANRLAFLGATSGVTCQQDAIVLGGTLKPIISDYDDPDSAFQGYGTVISNCYFNNVRRAVFARSYCNQVQIAWNMMDKGCGTNLAGGAIIDIDGSLDLGAGTNDGDYCTNNLIQGNYLHAVGGHTYGIKIKKGFGNLLIGNGFIDPGPNKTALVHFEGTTIDAIDYPSINNWVIGNALTHVTTQISEDTMSSRRNFLLGTAESGSTLPKSLQLGRGAQRLVVGTPSATEDFAITDGTTEFLRLAQGAGGQWEVGGPVTLEGNSTGAGTTALTLGNNSTVADAILNFNPPTGRQNQIQFKRAGVNSWLFYDAGSGDFYFRDSVNSTMTMTLKPGAAGVSRVEVGGFLRVVGAKIEMASGGPQILAGSGTPEGARTAPVGSTYQRTDGGAGTSFYVKESGTGNTGWVAK